MGAQRAASVARERVLDPAQTAHRSGHSQNVTTTSYQMTAEELFPLRPGQSPELKRFSRVSAGDLGSPATDNHFIDKVLSSFVPNRPAAPEKAAGPSVRTDSVGPQHETNLTQSGLSGRFSNDQPGVNDTIRQANGSCQNR